MNRYPCPCCGYFTFESKEDAFFEICSVCFWQDDRTELDEPSGANHGLTLRQARLNFKEFKACDKRSIKSVRDPRDYECKR